MNKNDEVKQFQKDHKKQPNEEFAATIKKKCKNDEETKKKRTLKWYPPNNLEGFYKMKRKRGRKNELSSGARVSKFGDFSKKEKVNDTSSGGGCKKFETFLLTQVLGKGLYTTPFLLYLRKRKRQ